MVETNRYDELVAQAQDAKQQYLEQLQAVAAEQASDQAIADASRSRAAALAALDADGRKRQVEDLSAALGLAIGRWDWAEVTRLAAAISAASAAQAAAQQAFDRADQAVQRASSDQAAARDQSVQENAERLAALAAVRDLATALR